MFTNQSILETNADPYPSLISVIGQVPYLEPGQLFFYLFAILIFTFLLGLMNAANTAFENISESNIFQLKKSEETQDKKILALLDKPATLKAAIVSAQTILLVAIVAIAVTLLDRIVFFPQYLLLGILIKLIFIAIYLLLTVMYVPNVYAHKHHLLFVRKITGLIRFIQWLLKPLILLILLLTKAINKAIKPPFQFSEKELCYMFDNYNRFSSGLMYTKNSKALDNFQNCILDFINNSNNFMTEMTVLSNYYVLNKDKVQILPTYWESDNVPLITYSNYNKYNDSIFDALAIGCFLLGMDPIHTNKVIKTNLHAHWCLINYTDLTFEWKCDENGRKKPYVWNGNKFILINNLHVHSKDLKNGLSLPLTVSTS